MSLEEAVVDAGASRSFLFLFFTGTLFLLYTSTCSR